MTQRMTILAGFLFLCTTASAHEWTSADGMVSVQIPNVERFDELDTVGMVRHWRSKDGMVHLGIIQDRWPSNRPVRRDLLEQGFLREVGGELVSSSIQRVDGRDILAVTVQTEESGFDLYFTQVMLTAGQYIYKFMTISIESSVADYPEAREFLDSVQVMKPSREVTNASFRAASGRDGERDAEAIAGAVGEMIGYLTIPGLLLALLFRRKKSPAV